MVRMNKTEVKYFILLAFADLNQFQYFLFSVFLVTFVTCVMGNIAVIVLIRLEPSLHTSMYFFISVFSALEVIAVSVTVPKLLANLIAANNIITFNNCIIQMYVFISLGATECFLLAVMVFDRYLAITKPLHYPLVMTHVLCKKLAVLPWILGFTITSLPAIVTALSEFCGPNMVDHFLCDLAPLQNLSCSDPFISIITTSIAVVLGIILPFLIIMGFYLNIIKTVSMIKNKEGKWKAFSTCSSHLIVACLFFGTSITVYGNPKESCYDKYLSFMYTAFTPMINPFIYTYRNRDVKKACRTLIIRHLKLR